MVRSKCAELWTPRIRTDKLLDERLVHDLRPMSVVELFPGTALIRN